jgi:hypothetical protein
VARAEADYQGLVLWHEAPFAFGANLKEVAEAIAAGEFELLEKYVAEFQNASMASSTPRCRWLRRCRAWRWAAVASS